MFQSVCDIAGNVRPDKMDRQASILTLRSDSIDPLARLRERAGVRGTIMAPTTIMIRGGAYRHYR